MYIWLYIYIYIYILLGCGFVDSFEKAVSKALSTKVERALETRFVHTFFSKNKERERDQIAKLSRA
jgi:hypothetical protein